jgi:hypothetical protein
MNPSQKLDNLTFCRGCMNEPALYKDILWRLSDKRHLSKRSERRWVILWNLKRFQKVLQLPTSLILIWVILPCMKTRWFLLFWYSTLKENIQCSQYKPVISISLPASANTHFGINEVWLLQSLFPRALLSLSDIILITVCNFCLLGCLNVRDRQTNTQAAKGIMLIIQRQIRPLIQRIPSHANMPIAITKMTQPD